MTERLDVRPEEITRRLRQVVLFAHLDTVGLDRVQRAMRMRECRGKEPVFLSCDEPRSLYLLMHGRVKITRTDPHTGRELILRIVQPGEAFGTLLQTSASPSNTSGFAMQRSVVGCIRGPEFNQLLGDPHFVGALHQMVEQRMENIAERLEDLTFRSVPARLARLLLRLAEEFPKDQGGHTAIDVMLTQQDIANMIGATRETANIVLNEFRRMGFIEMRRQTFVIRDPGGLEAATS